MPVEELLPEGNKSPQVQSDRITRNYRHVNVYFKLFGVFKKNKKKWDKYHKVNTKLRECIQSTVAPQKKATLHSIYPVQQWLTAFRNSTALQVETIRLNIQLEYRKLIGSMYFD